MLVDHLVKIGFPLSNAEDVQLAQELIAQGDADPDGATNWAAASAQMAHLGIPNTPYGPDWFTSHDYVPVVMAALDRGIPVLFGLSNAHATYDDWTSQGTNDGVYGHAIALMGYDATGAIVADPNTQQATRGDFVHYGWQNLRDAGASSMLIPEGRMMGIPEGWADDGTTLKTPNGVMVVHGFRDWVMRHPWDADDWPMEAEVGNVQVESAYAAGTGSRQVFRKHLLCWLPDRGVYEAWTGANYFALLGGKAQEEKQVAAAQQQEAILQAQIATLKAELTAAQQADAKKRKRWRLGR
jgi:hypothetical protein